MHLVLLALLFLHAGCASDRDLGRRAFLAGHYEQALKYYDKEIAEGTRDPALYHEAALAATRVGNFASAERYYSLALRYGGGLEVARDLAQFYVQTSNYARAVRVFQFLLRHEQDPQPVFNNLGTALMYSGLHFDAEGYLLIAQQMDPNDPVPYVNLGLLYDRHLRQPWLGAAFYRCYLQLATQDGEQVRMVRTRLEEMRVRGQSPPQDVELECGKVYRPSGQAVASGNQRPTDADQGELGAPGAAPGRREVGEELGAISTDPIAPDDQGAAGEIVIERADGTRVQESTTGGAGVRTSGEGNASLHEAFEAGRFEEIVRELSKRPVDSLEAWDMAMLGISMARTGRVRESVPVLEWSLGREPHPQTVEVLLEVYALMEYNERSRELCRQFQGQAEFQGATERCASAPSEGS